MKYIIKFKKMKSKLSFLFNRAYIYLVINIFLFSYISLKVKVLSTNEIHLLIQGSGEQSILNENFYIEPIEVYVNNTKKESCKKICELLSEYNDIKLIFDDNINSCINMFKGLNNILSIDLSNFDFSQVINMNSMFKDCQNLKNINFGNINTTMVEDMASLFENCKNLESIDVSNFKTSKVRSMQGMFSNCVNLKAIDVSNFDTSNIINMHEMFSHCEILKSIDVSNFKTSYTREMMDMFGYCYALKTLDLTNLDTSKVQNIQGIIFACSNLKYLDMSTFKADSLINVRYLFGNVKSLKYVNLRNFKILDTSKILNYEPIFLGSTIKLNIKFCIEDEETKNFIIGDMASDCSDFCFQENILFDYENNICICNENYKFKYNNKCYNVCPENTHEILQDIYKCIETIPENYYLVNNDNIYKECYNKC